ncbi:hypothetical protein EBR11_06555 [bacterium]|nr:hypothetical protein [bacterium]
MMKKYTPLFLITAALLVGCANNATSTVLESGTSQVQTRQMQSRVFDTNDKEKTLRTVIATLQDLGFVIDKADLTLGSVTATKLDGYALKMSVTVRPRNAKQLLVRANAQYEEQAVTDPKTYQAFFTSFEKAMFLTAHEVD